MGLFGTFSFNEPKKKDPTLVQMAEAIFGADRDLMGEIKTYLASRKQQHNLPTKISWKMQLEILQDIPEQERADEVRNCTVKGYRQMAYKKDRKYSNRNIQNVCTQGVYRHKKEIKVVNQAF